MKLVYVKIYKLKRGIKTEDLNKYGFDYGMRDLKNDKWSYVEVLDDFFYTVYDDDSYFDPSKENEIKDLIEDGLVELVEI